MFTYPMDSPSIYLAFSLHLIRIVLWLLRLTMCQIFWPTVNYGANRHQIGYTMGIIEGKENGERGKEGEYVKERMKDRGVENEKAIAKSMSTCVFQVLCVNEFHCLRSAFNMYLILFQSNWIGSYTFARQLGSLRLLDDNKVEGKMNNFAFTPNARKSSIQANLYRQLQPSPPPTQERRESLVKPTWQNVCPGEVPLETLEKLDRLCNGEQICILSQQQVNWSKRRILEILSKLIAPNYICVV